MTVNKYGLNSKKNATITLSSIWKDSNLSPKHLGV